MTIYPILLLHIKSIICPCFLSSTERDAWTALRNLRGLRIVYQEPLRSDRTITIETVTDKVSEWFHSWKKNMKEEDVNHRHISQSRSSTSPSTSLYSHSIVASEWNGICSIVDSFMDDDGPCLQIRSLVPLDPKNNDSRSMNHNSNPKDIRIPLDSIGTINPYTSHDADGKEGVMIYQRGQQENVLLCQFRLISESDTEPVSSEEVIQYLRMILQWVQEKLSIHDISTTSSTTATKSPSSFTSQAMKIKHFAKREMELQTMKKEREERKQRYMKESGGLKYTALAMANRHDEIV